VTANDAPTGDVNDQSSKMYFFKIKAGLSRATMTAAERHIRVITFTFANPRGQPEQIRFRPAPSEPWTDWQPFSTQVSLNFAAALVQYQLKSRMGVESAIFDVPPSMQIALVKTGLHHWMRYY